MAKKKQGGKLKQQKRPRPKYLGVKVAQGQKVLAGSILVKQKGTKFSAGDGVKVAKDHSLFALKEGKVMFGQRMGKKFISVV